MGGRDYPDCQHDLISQKQVCDLILKHCQHLMFLNLSFESVDGPTS